MDLQVHYWHSKIKVQQGYEYFYFHTFAAFLLLTYSKVLSVSFNSLYHSEIIQDSSGEKQVL